MGTARLVGIAPVLPVRDLPAALAHYESLGFRTRRFADGEDYGFVSRNGVELHLTHQPTSRYPAGAIAVVYLFVEDAVALYRKWTKPGIAGQTEPPSPTAWGMSEGMHTDPDGNIIRFGSPIEDHSHAEE